jgi:hypothetical protein
MKYSTPSAENLFKIYPVSFADVQSSFHYVTALLRQTSHGDAPARLRLSRSVWAVTVAVDFAHNPALFPEIERMATAICNGDVDPLLFEQALVIAENELKLRCVRLERVAVIERLRDVAARPLSKRDSNVTRAKARFRAAKFQYRRLARAKVEKAAVNNGQARDSTRDSTQKQASEPAQPTRKQKPNSHLRRLQSRRAAAGYATHRLSQRPIVRRWAPYLGAFRQGLLFSPPSHSLAGYLTGKRLTIP